MDSLHHVLEREGPFHATSPGGVVCAHQQSAAWIWICDTSSGKIMCVCTCLYLEGGPRRLTLPFRQSVMFRTHKTPFTLLIYAKSILMFLTDHV